MPDFFIQPEAVLFPPKGKSRVNISWTWSNVECGFKLFFERHGKWPDRVDINECEFLPNIKTLERKFGGIREVRKRLGLPITDLSRGKSRSMIASKIGKRGFDLENEVYETLARRFHEPFVHIQSRVLIEPQTTSAFVRRSIKLDFLVYYRTGKFAVDVFFPDAHKFHFSDNVAVKYRLYRTFPFDLFLVVGNPAITDDMVRNNSNMARNERNSRITLSTLSDFERKITGYEPLNDPYLPNES